MDESFYQEWIKSIAEKLNIDTSQFCGSIMYDIENKINDMSRYSMVIEALDEVYGQTPDELISEYYEYMAYKHTR